VIAQVHPIMATPNPTMTSVKSPSLDERRFRVLIDAVTDYAIYMLDPEGKIISWNPGAERINGYKLDEVVGQSYALFFRDEDRKQGRPARSLEMARRNGRSEDEGWRVRKDGTLFWTLAVIDAIRDEDGRVVGFAKITRDITERHNVQEALLESERKFRLFVDGVHDYAIYMLDPDGRIINWNSGAQRAHQYTAEQIIGENYRVVFTAEDQEQGEPENALAIAQASGKYEAEGWRLRKDGTRFWASIVIDKICNQRGELLGFAKITRDISERRDAQKALDDAREQLFQSQKLEAIGQLTGGVAHDFNNQLAAILSGISLVERLVATKDEKLKHLLETMRQATQRGHGLTRQLLTFSRRQPLRPETIDVRKRLRETLELLDRLLSGNIKMTMNIAEILSPIEVDPAEFELAILNVCLNARDAMPRGGALTVHARNESLRSEKTGLAERFVVISFADTGIGIPEALKKRVFEPFFTTKDVGKGSGLGLSQAYGFAQGSGGALDITSEVGKGTTVAFRFPAAEPKPHVISPEDVNVMATAHDSGTVLLIEDDLSLAELTSALLEHAGYTVKVAHSAAAALNMLKRGSRIDAVFSDIVMPGGMNGFQLARTLRKEFPEVPVLLTTGFSGAADVAQIRGIEIIPKPYDPDRVTSQLAKLIAESRRRPAH
jgi:PAS domain S-box-containing protein